MTAEGANGSNRGGDDLFKNSQSKDKCLNLCGRGGVQGLKTGSLWGS